MAKSSPRRDSGIGAGAPCGPWRLLLLLALAVAVPTVCVLYFTNQAMRNARLAVRQKLADAYKPPLQTAVSEIASYWQEKAAVLETTARDGAAPVRFAELVTSGACDGAIIYDEAGGVTYPGEGSLPDIGRAEPTPPWGEARRLVEAGDIREAVELLAGVLEDPENADARDTAGRLTAPLAGLRALELIADPEAPRHVEIRDTLAERLNEYSPPPMPSAQRRFLMRRLLEMPGGKVAFPTLAAEELAADYLARNTSAK